MPAIWSLFKLLPEATTWQMCVSLPGARPGSSFQSFWGTVARAGFATPRGDRTARHEFAGSDPWEHPVNLDEGSVVSVRGDVTARATCTARGDATARVGYPPRGDAAVSGAAVKERARTVPGRRRSSIRFGVGGVSARRGSRPGRMDTVRKACRPSGVAPEDNRVTPTVSLSLPPFVH